MSGIEVVYTIHKFEAENPDEISINVGEKVIVLERDEGFNDGWWQGRNERGDVGLFPITYTVRQPPSITSSITLENKIDSLENAISKMKIPAQQKKPLLHQSLSSTASISSKNIQSIVMESLTNPLLNNKPVEEWTSEQVAEWLISIGFDKELADKFRDQEISGDILLELSLDSLKELQITTFGKRFKIHNAINALRQETAARIKNNNAKRYSDASTIMSVNNSLSDITFKRQQQQQYPDDDLVSNYSTVIQSPQSAARQSSFIQQQGGFYDAQNNATARLSTLRNRSSSIEWKRNTINSTNNIEPGRYSFMRSPSVSKLQNVLPTNTPTVRRSEELSALSDIPDMEGWLYKQGDRYKNWNKRWFVLKAHTLYYFKNPKSPRIKGIINLKGYRIDVDETIHPGKYCFMAHHEKERTFYFYTDYEKLMKDWMKALMKATISRDYASPVMSSNTIPTVSLEAARRMRPRPPSTIFHGQKDSLQQFTNVASQQGFSRHFSLLSVNEEDQQQQQQEELTVRMNSGSRAPSVMSTNSNVLRYHQHHKPIHMFSSDHASDNYSMDSSSYNRLKDSGFNSTHGSGLRRSVTGDSNSSQSSSGHQAIPSMIRQQSSNAYYPNEEEEDLIDPEHMSVMESNRHFLQGDDEEKSDQYERYVHWINSYIQNNSKIRRLSELNTGEVLLEFLEQITQKTIERHMAITGRSVNDQKMDRIIAAFKFMTLEGVELDGVCTIRDVLNGNENKVMQLLNAIEYWSKSIVASHKMMNSKKMASGGTFGEEDQNNLKELENN